MKPFKQKDNLYICEECNNKFKNLSSLSKHIKHNHNNTKNYFDKWILENGENLCKVCGKEAIFFDISKGYKNGCCKKHIDLYGYECRKKVLLEKYGVENNFQREDCKEKMKLTWLENYGVEHPRKSEKILNKTKQTNLKRYGCEHNFCKNHPSRKKWERRLLEEEGITNVFQREDVKEKSKQTLLDRYGVENPLQDIEIFKKSFKTRINLHYYKDTNLTYQGSYELDFLDNFYKQLDILNGPSFKYIVNNKNKIYHSDFYISSLNLIVEIKNSYLADKDKEEIDLKKNAVLKEGYNYIMIINKNYKKLIKKWL